MPPPERRGLLAMRVVNVTHKTLNRAKQGLLPASRSAKDWPIGSTLRLMTNAGDEVQAEIDRIEPHGTAYTVRLTNIKVIRDGNSEPEYRPSHRRGVRPRVRVNQIGQG